MDILCRYYMALHIERVPVTTARKATKVLQLCHKFQLKEQGTYNVPLLSPSPPSSSPNLPLALPPAGSVCRVLAMREFKAGRLGAALSWCLQAKDAVFTAFLAEK